VPASPPPMSAWLARSWCAFARNYHRPRGRRRRVPP
jgi:hypothetical protein